LSGLQTLSEIFNNRIFRIPDYQRGFAWEKPQLVDFWEDVMNILPGQSHYTGMLSIKRIEKEDSKTWNEYEWIKYKAYHIVDGQQRLTTFSILIFSIVSYLRSINEGKDSRDIYLAGRSLDRIEEDFIRIVEKQHGIGVAYLFGYEVDKPSDDYLRYEIFEKPDGSQIQNTYYTRNLKVAKLFFDENIRKIYNERGDDGLTLLYNNLTKQLMFNVHEIDDDFDVFVAFETMNNRGKQLSNLELLKNRLIYLNSLFNIDNKLKETLRKNINESWREVYRQLGRNSDTLLPDDDYLKAHWTMYFHYSRSRANAYTEWLFKDKFTARNLCRYQAVDDTFPADDTYVDEYGDNDLSEQFEEIDSDDFYLSPDTVTADDESKKETVKPEDINDYINSLKNMAQYWYFLHNPYDSESPLTPDEKDWVDKLNRIGIGYFRPLVAVTLSLKHVAVERRVELLKTIERFIFILLRTGYAPSNFQSSVFLRKTRELFRNELSVEDIVNSLNVKLNSDIDSIIKIFIAKMKKRFDDGGGFYWWNGLRYFMFEYELYLAGNKGRPSGIDNWKMFINPHGQKAITIEHIFPQTPDNEYWLKHFSKFDKKQQTFLASSLGNLLPLKHSINSSLQNDAFPDKKNKNSKRTGYNEGSLSEREVADNYEDWTAEAILKRGKDLIKFMCKRWDIEITDEQNSELLNLQFVEDDIL